MGLARGPALLCIEREGADGFDSVRPLGDRDSISKVLEDVW